MPWGDVTLRKTSNSLVYLRVSLAGGSFNAVINGLGVTMK